MLASEPEGHRRTARQCCSAIGSNPPLRGRDHGYDDGDGGDDGDDCGGDRFCGCRHQEEEDKAGWEVSGVDDPGCKGATSTRSSQARTGRRRVDVAEGAAETSSRHGAGTRCRERVGSP